MNDYRRTMRRNITVLVTLAVAFAGAAIAIILTCQWYVSVTIVVMYILSLVFAFYLFVWRQYKERRLAETGAPGIAKVLDADPTGTIINDRFQVVKLKLEVQPEGGEPYITRKRITPHLGMVPYYRAGLVLPVRIDRKNPKRVAFVEEAAAGAGAPATTASQVGTGAGQPFPGQVFVQGKQAAELLKNLGLGNLVSGTGDASVNVTTGDSTGHPAQAKAQGVSQGDEGNAAIQEIVDQADYDVLANGEEAEAIILKVTDMGVRLAGKNPAVKMIVDVQPEGRPSFQAEVAGFVAEASVHKLLVGKKLLVKYDPYDTTKVAIYRTAPEKGEEPPRIIE